VEKVVKDFFWLAKSNNIQIKVDIEKKLPKIITDPQKISHVFYNFLNNAIRYSKERGMVWIKLKKVDDRIYCEVKDSGIGIAREDQKYIFKKFFRGRHVLRYRTQGMGLGLFISKEIIRNLGGKIGFLVMRKWESIDIDEPKDFEFTEFLLMKTGRCKK